jgi:hypothetical protein
MVSGTVFDRELWRERNEAAAEDFKIVPDTILLFSQQDLAAFGNRCSISKSQS